MKCMKYRATVINDLENAKQMIESIKKGLDNRSMTPIEMYELNKKVLNYVTRALQRVNLEYDETR